ncbi:hypothetical protein F6R98_05360 [Candidatus Methylospira mobilis]|uniref:Uncharacterized protein n=1 Tax=Candidatus Methylospira mobilis TaxID=1808979 RepID=A0A5Q0BJZ4_9GAMM|nr:hypothetical protein [Candidatus Methylospira mobilis]QFY42126.1 hypothetical protein F6R98_05360 [Candidatus Methylospira mobilis]WNV03139.1 hypothetical protein RP726_11730 [Candidatus Methylospira mobilis]
MTVSYDDLLPNATRLPPRPGIPPASAATLSGQGQNADADALGSLPGITATKPQSSNTQPLRLMPADFESGYARPPQAATGNAQTPRALNANDCEAGWKAANQASAGGVIGPAADKELSIPQRIAGTAQKIGRMATDFPTHLKGRLRIRLKAALPTTRTISTLLIRRMRKMADFRL